MERLLCTFVFIFWRQIYKLYQSSDYNAESKFPLFMELAFFEKLKFFTFFAIQIQFLIFPPKNLEKIRALKISMHQFVIENYEAL